MTALSLQSLHVEKFPCLKRSKSEDAKLRPCSPYEESENDEEDGVDEGARCRTPLLHRTEAVTSPRRSVRTGLETKDMGRHMKKVSFTNARSSSESETDSPTSPSKSASYSLTGAKESRRPSEEKRFALVPAEESLVGWNQSGGPFTSQWLFQAVNPISNRDEKISSMYLKDEGKSAC